MEKLRIAEMKDIHLKTESLQIAAFFKKAIRGGK